MSTFRPRKKIRLYAFTATSGLSELLPPVRLSNALPRWWEQLATFVELRNPRDPRLRPQTMQKAPTARQCYSMQEVLARGIGIPLWTDIHIAIQADGQVSAEGHNRDVPRAGETHPRQQFQGMLNDNTQHFKFVSPWSFVCKSPLHFAWSHPFYHQPNPFKFHTLPGIAEYRNQHGTNVNVVLPRRPNQRDDFDFAAGEMLAYIFPMSDERIELVVEEVSTQDLARINVASQVTSRPILFNKKHKVLPWIPHTRTWFGKRIGRSKSAI